MSVGDPGPYMDDEGGVWVPRTVPYLKARHIAKEAAYYRDSGDDRLVYDGKVNATMFGFVRDCWCEDGCEAANRCRTCHADQSECECATPDLEDFDVCMAPAWAFRLVER